MAVASLPMVGAGLLLVASTPGGPGQLTSLVALLQPTTGQAADATEAVPTMPPQLEDSVHVTETPRTVTQMLELEARVRQTVEAAVPATVGLVVGGGVGSGVLISPDGLILTAGHVSGEPGQRCRVILHDGTVYQGRTLGRSEQSLDAGMVRITDPAAPDDLPFVPLGRSDALEIGTWTVALGHPGGYEDDRPPVVRVGRLNSVGDELIQSDNPLVGGDSGGPLFDLDGRVIGIHSRIGNSALINIHVPVDRYADLWQPLASGVDGYDGFRMPGFLRTRTADDGIRLDLGGLQPRESGRSPGSDGREGATVRLVIPGSPADEAGLRVGDRIVAVNGEPIRTEGELLERRRRLRPDHDVVYLVRRDEEEVREIRLTPTRGELREGLDPNLPYYNGVIGIEFGQMRGQPVVGSVQPGGPAEEVGMQPGDVITELRGVRVVDAEDVISLLSQARGGDQVVLKVRRGDDEAARELEFTVILANRGDLFPG
jgi:serine protease Do